MSQVITADDLETYMGKTLNDGIAQQVVDGINGWLDTYTGRCFGETKQLTERYDWARNFYLRHMDVVSVDEIQLGYPGQAMTTMDPTGYWVNPTGRVTMLWQMSSGSRSPYFHDYMNVTYTYGQAEVPDDLKMAVLGVAGGYYNFAVNGQQDIVAASVGSYHLQYAGSVRSGSGTPDPAKSTPDANWGIIDRYRMRRV